MLNKPTHLLMVLGSVLLNGCGSSVLLVPSGTPVQLAEPVTARVFVVQKDGTKIKSANRVEIPAGWWAADVPEEPGIAPEIAP